MYKVKDFQPEKVADAIYNYIRDNAGKDRSVLGYFYDIDHIEVCEKDTVRAKLFVSLKHREAAQEYKLYTAEVLYRAKVQETMTVEVSTVTCNALRSDVIERALLKDKVIKSPCVPQNFIKTVDSREMPVHVDDRRQLSLEKLYTATAVVLEPIMQAVPLDLETAIQVIQDKD